MSELREYLNTTFPGLHLMPSLYHQWEIGLHFELGEGIYQLTDDGRLNHDRFNRVYSQALSIFHQLFSDEDEMFLVTNVYERKDPKFKKKRLNVYSRSIKNKALKFTLRQEILPYLLDDEEADEYYTAQFSLTCRKRDLRYPLLIRAAYNKDFPRLKPRLGGKKSLHYPDLFFVNVSKNIIYFIYDDRGCEVIAVDQESIRSVYEKYYDWIDDDYKSEIDTRFLR
jgi:Domain of unknown function (DUF3885)